MYCWASQQASKTNRLYFTAQWQNLGYKHCRVGRCESASKISSNAFTYCGEGLYLVTKYWKEIRRNSGTHVYKFKLVKKEDGRQYDPEWKNIGGISFVPSLVSPNSSSDILKSSRELWLPRKAKGITRRLSSVVYVTNQPISVDD
ncbi:hypothetical protein F3Y22_tig00110597pilonHSYRG00796 [Hibiscus syriacus]|uniref:YDG domain-containing protein n=1 Tax=Hibiscus syriacus TaxID=106335 RepID=A0A6A3A6L4_HIBSY|nr:hypothetical protein F3Y22_tig00110597pilonHSYRG00796 [Hibiscus syriacus]